MLKKNIFLFLLIICTSCLGLPIPCQAIYRSESISPKIQTFLCGKGSATKYRCKKAGDCCEIGKNCEEDIKKKETTK